MNLTNMKVRKKFYKSETRNVVCNLLRDAFETLVFSSRLCLDVQILVIRFAFIYNNAIAGKISDAFANSFTAKVVETSSDI